MSFSSGLHYWEVLATISCSNIHVGVYNPVSKYEATVSFFNKSPRSITCCLNLDQREGTVKFWLNNRLASKSLKLPLGGPWIPCVKIGVEKNTLTLNPFPREPMPFLEAQKDCSDRLDTLLMPHLNNGLCVTNLPLIEPKSREETGKMLTQLF